MLERHRTPKRFLLPLGLVLLCLPTVLHGQTATEERLRTEERLQRIQERLQEVEGLRRAQIAETLARVRERLAQTRERLAQTEGRERELDEVRMAQVRRALEQAESRSREAEAVQRERVQQSMAEVQTRLEETRAALEAQRAQEQRARREALVRVEEGMTRLRERTPWRGLELAEMNSGLARYFGSEEGILVLQVEEDSGLGVVPGDVILSLDGRTVEDRSDVARILGSYGPGEPISITVVREGSRMNLKGTIR